MIPIGRNEVGMEKVSIETWLARNYAPGDGPAVKTVRAWCRDGKIYPAPQKQGRAYSLDARACYVDPRDPVSLRAARALDALG